jgi:hypothetical protein
MAIYLITYELSDGAREADILAYIRATGYAMLTRSSYVVIRNNTTEQIVTDMRAMARDAIQVYVFTIAKPYFGFGQTEVNTWLATVLP